MIKKITRNHTYLLLACILFIGIFLRAHNLSTWPREGATFDEFAWTWLGISIIKEHSPSSWSPHLAYDGHRQHVVYKNAHFWIVEPYLEHPPFFGLVAGSFALLNGATNFYDVEIYKIRPLALIMGVLSILFLYLLIKEIYDEKTALLSALIYSLMPTVAVGSRLVQNENFFIPLFLLSLFLIARFIKSKKHKYFIFASIIAGILSVSKVPWLAAALSISMILFINKRNREVIKLIFIVFIFFSLFILMGLLLNKEIFIDLWKLQLARYDLTFNSIYALFTSPFLADRHLIDGWIYFGWFAFILLLVKDFRKNHFLILSFLGYFAVFIFAIPNESGHGWYRYPFYPFLAVSIALFIREYFNKNFMLTFFFIIFLVTSLLQLSWGVQFGFSFKLFRLFLISTSISLLPLFFKNKNFIKFSKLYNFLMLVFIFSLSFWSVMEYTEQ